MNMYDPPSGWKYGFPKPYNPLPNESIEDTLVRDGYPKHMLELARWTRFWGDTIEEVLKEKSDGTNPTA
jgi:hypothetical protein